MPRTHVPVLAGELIEALDPQPGQIAVDCTLGFGGHARALLARILPGGRLIGLDVDPLELPRTEARLRAAGFAVEALTTRRSNFAGLPRVLDESGIAGADQDHVLAEPGVRQEVA